MSRQHPLGSRPFDGDAALAQVLEQPVTGIVVFADVDLLPEETDVDFSTHKLPPAPKLNTVGLWVGLHGESFLEAGMHHLEARFDFDGLRDQLRQQGVNTMCGSKA